MLLRDELGVVRLLFALGCVCRVGLVRAPHWRQCSPLRSLDTGITMVYAVIRPGALAVSRFAFLRFAVFLLCPLSSPPVEGFVFVLCWFPFLVPSFVELILLLAGASVAPGSGCLVLPGLRRLPRSFRYLGRFAAASRVAGTRQVERFAECSFRHLPQVVSHPGG